MNTAAAHTCTAAAHTCTEAAHTCTAAGQVRNTGGKLVQNKAEVGAASGAPGLFHTCGVVRDAAPGFNPFPVACLVGEKHWSKNTRNVAVCGCVWSFSTNFPYSLKERGRLAKHYTPLFLTYAGASYKGISVLSMIFAFLSKFQAAFNLSKATSSLSSWRLPNK